MEETALPLDRAVKDEPCDVCSDLNVSFGVWGYPNPGLELSTTFSVHEEDVKTEEKPNALEIGAVQKRYCSSLLPQKTLQLIGKKKHELTYLNYVKIAKDYADLYKNDIIIAPTHRHFIFPSIIIECPDCMLPVGGQSHSSFLKLLQHVSRKHSTTFDLIFADIVERYAPYVEFMKKKIICRQRRLYLKRLRQLQHRKI